MGWIPSTEKKERKEGREAKRKKRKERRKGVREEEKRNVTLR
jgi:hypothetical protein